MEEFKRWADQQLQSLLQFDSLAGVVDSLVSFRQEDELRAYLRDFLGEGPSQTEFVNEFLERRKAIRHLLDMPSVDGGGLKVLRKPKSDLEDYYGGVKETGGKGHRRSPARSQRSGGSSAPTSSQATDGSIGHAEEPGSKWAGGEKVHPASLPYFIHFIFQVCSGRLASYDSQEREVLRQRKLP